MRSKFIAFFCLTFAVFTAYSQCNVTINASTLTVPCGGANVTVTANGSGYSTTPVNNSFDAGNAGTGWNVSPAGQFNNPCDPSFDGGGYMWMGNTTAAPRTLETAPLDLSCGGDVCFYLDMATQGGAGSCEGPDLTNEGVYFEYSTNGGATWTTIQYFQPNFGGTAGPYLNWAQYCFPIPVAAQTTNTVLHWFQGGSSGNCCDHWGIDNVVVSATGCGAVWYDWDNIPGTTGPAGDPASQTIFVDQDTTLTLTYTDGAGFSCSETVTITVAGMQAPTFVTTDETCFGDNDGDVVITPGAGGVGPYNFDLTSGPNTPLSSGTGTFTGLTPGTYAVDVTDIGSGCVASGTFTINPGPSCCTLGHTEAFTDANCNAANATCDGTITLTATNPIGSAIFSIDGGVTTQAIGNFTGLCAGTYDIRVEDADGCLSTSAIVIAEPAPLDIIENTTTTTCGTSNGDITLAGAGGTPAYEFSFDGGATFSVANSLAGIPAGAYDCVIRDANGCTFTEIVNVSNLPAQIIDNVAITNTTCNGICNGELDITVSNGTPPYQYSVDNGATFGAGNVFTNLCPGTYNIVTLDQNNCQVFDVAVITEPGALQYNITLTDVSCIGGNDGAIEFTGMAGGTAPYDFSTDGGGTFSTNPLFQNLTVGTYDLVFRDANLCFITATVDILEPTALQLNFTTVDATCNEYCDGEADAVVNGGVGPYSYAWGAGLGVPITNSTATGLCAGTYDLTITDQNGCTIDTIGYVINEPAVFEITNIAPTDETCFGQCDGALDFTAAGATRYSVDLGATFQPGNVFNNLCVGTYDVVIQNAAGCRDTLQATVGGPFALGLTANGDTTICVGGSADIDAVAAGGTAPYTYDWDIPATGANQTVMPIATTTYSVIATDANGCSSPPQDVTVTVNPTLQVNAPNVGAICIGEITTITAAAVAGNGGPYTYEWTDDQGGPVLYGPTHSVSPTATTTFTVTVEDGCETLPVTAIVTLNVNSLPDIDLAIDDPDGCVNHTVSFSNLTSAGLTGTCFWDFGDGATSTDCDPTHIYTVPGYYDVSLMVTSPQGCVSDTTVIAIANPCQLIIPNVFTPNSDGVNDFFVVDGLERYPNTLLQVFNRWGQVVYENENYDNSWDGTNMSGAKVSDGTYYFIIRYTRLDELEDVTGTVNIFRNQ
jgi:gliding motility-associated-like protein